MKHRLRFDAALAALAQQQAAVVAQLRHTPSDDALLSAKRELDHAVRCLQWCERHQLHPDATVQALPWPRDHFGGFGVVELDEVGEPLGLPPLLTPQGQRLELGVGDLLIQQTHPFNLPPQDEGQTP